MDIKTFLETQSPDCGSAVGMNFSNAFVIPVANSFGNEESIQFLACVASHSLAHLRECVGDDFDYILKQVIENGKKL